MVKTLRDAEVLILRLQREVEYLRKQIQTLFGTKMDKVEPKAQEEER